MIAQEAVVALVVSELDALGVPFEITELLDRLHPARSDPPGEAGS